MKTRRQNPLASVRATAAGLTVRIVNHPLLALALGLLLGVDSASGQSAALASSADGTRLVAAADVDSGWSVVRIDAGPIYVSTNAGATWTQTSATRCIWPASAVASSANGTKLVVAANADDSDNPGRIYTSADSGCTWKPTGAPSNYWGAVASSADATKLVAAAAGEIWRSHIGLLTFGSGPIYISTDAGATWTQTTAPSKNWAALASSADGTKLVAADGGGSSQGLIYTSADSGATWRAVSASGNHWHSVASSADGTKLLAAAMWDLNGDPGLIYSSKDSGVTWRPTGAPSNYWSSVTASADGAEVAAAGLSGAVSISVDSGVTWTATVVASGGRMGSVAMSADGTRLVVADQEGGLHTLQTVLLHIELSGDEARLVWPRGTLQRASQASGPYQDVANAASPYDLAPSAPQQFYRVRIQ